MVLGVHTPETSSERVVDNVRRAASEAGLKFPIVIDNERKNWSAWGNSKWPSVYLIDKQGDVRYWWYGELKWRSNDHQLVVRERIAQLLAEK